MTKYGSGSGFQQLHPASLIEMRSRDVSADTRHGIEKIFGGILPEHCEGLDGSTRTSQTVESTLQRISQRRRNVAQPFGVLSQGIIGDERKRQLLE